MPSACWATPGCAACSGWAIGAVARHAGRRCSSASRRWSSWASNTGYGWLDRTFQVLGGLGTAVVAWFLFPSIVVAVSGIFLDRVVDATEDGTIPRLLPARGRCRWRRALLRSR